MTRDSLVANMLLSLDQFSLAQKQDHGPFSPGTDLAGSTPYDADERDEYPPSARRWANNGGRSYGPGVNANGRGHEHSYSSDADHPDDASRYSSQNSRGHRSNSGSVNFQGQFTRLNSLREPSYRTQPGTTPPRSAHARGRHSSKSSSSASFDAGYPPNVASQRHHNLQQQQRRTRRSASFDVSPPHSRAGHLHQVPASSPFRVDFSDTFVPMDDDDWYSAAPNPTVPSGPRREPSNLPIRPPPPESVDGRKVERRRSTSRSLKSVSARSKRTAAAAAPPAAASEHDSAPAPSVGYGKSKDADPPATAPAQAKEKQGFFRRVFGGGSSKNSGSSNGTAAGADQRSQDKARQQQQAKAATAPPSRDTSSSHSHHPPLQKKTSSFFRRRKKSIVDEASPADVAPPMPPLDQLNLRVREGAAVAHDSPTSSLRNVMNPYLETSGATGLGLAGVPTSSPLTDATSAAADGSQDRPRGRQEFKREFSPDYEPGPNARIRTVDSGAQGPRAGEADAQSAPQRLPKTFETRNNSFLDLDGASDHETRSPNQRRKKTRGAGAQDPASTPSSAARSPDADPDATVRAKKSPAPDADREPSRPNLGLPMEGARIASFASGSTETDYKTAPSAPPSVLVEGAPESKGLGTLKSMKSCKSLDEPEFVVGDPTADDRQKAKQIYDGGEDFIQKDKAAAWMGEEGPVRQRTLQAYMELYDFQDHSILAALRSVCGRLVLRAETQQVDRILVAFSKRWCDCNPRHGFKATGPTLVPAS